MKIMKPPAACNSLDEIRWHIDELDQQIVSLIGERFRYVKEVMRFKSTSNDIIAPERYNAVIASRRQMAVENGLSPDIVESLYRLLLNYFIEEERLILEKRKNNQ
jgi:isochorismate pyruvate lyase